jgi:hypothetical protein
MKKFKLLLIMALLFGLLSTAIAQETITPQDAVKFICQQKTVCGTVASAHFAASAQVPPPLFVPKYGGHSWFPYLS